MPFYGETVGLYIYRNVNFVGTIKKKIKNCKIYLSA